MVFNWIIFNNNGNVFVVVKYMTIENLDSNSVRENFPVLDYIANDNEECVWFCKYLKCDIFYQIKLHIF